MFVCLSVCLSISLFLIHGHSFEPIWTKFGMWLHTLWMVMGLASAARARDLALRAPGNSEWAAVVTDQAP